MEKSLIIFLVILAACGGTTQENLSEVSTTISVENNENNNSDTENETNSDQDNYEPPLEELINLNISLENFGNYDFVPTNNEKVNYFLNPTNRNPFTALLQVNTDFPHEELSQVLGQFKDEKINFEYDFHVQNKIIYIEAYFIGLNEDLIVEFLDKNGKILESLSFRLPIIETDSKFTVNKLNSSSSWLYISGANDGNVLFLDNESRVRALIEIPFEYTRGPERASAPFYEDKVVFFNSKEFKYYSLDFFGNLNYFFNNSLDFNFEYHHDISPSKFKNTHLILVNELSNLPFYEDVILEVDVNKNELIRTIDLKNILDFNQPVIRDAYYQVDEGIENEDKYDWFHANSVEYVAERNEIILSGRHLGIIGIDYESLALNWFLPHNPEHYVNSDFNYPILSADFDGFMPPNGQHNLTLVGNHIFYFDNQAIPDEFNGTENYNPYDLKSYFVKLEVDFSNLRILNQEKYSYKDYWSKVRGGIDYKSPALSNYLISFGGIYYDEFGARTLSRQTQPKTFEWIVVEFLDDELVREIFGKGRGAYRSLFFNP